MKNILKLYLLSLIFVAVPLFAMEGIAVIDMRTAVLSTQSAADAFKALEEDPDYSANLETHTVETHIYRLRKKMKEILDYSFKKSTLLEISGRIFWTMKKYSGQVSYLKNTKLCLRNCLMKPTKKNQWKY